MKKVVYLMIISLALVPLIGLNAQTVDLFWQGETYTPPFFQGRPLWSKQSKVTFVAIPQGLGSPASLNFKWSKNGTVLGSLSGTGKSSIQIFDSSLSKTITMKVQVISNSNNVLGEASMTLTPQTPQNVIYVNDPLYGNLFNHEVGDGYFIDEEVSFASFPLFFEAASRSESTLKYEWKTNSSVSQIGNKITYRAPEGNGVAIVSSMIKHSDNFLQTAGRSFSVKYGADK